MQKTTELLQALVAHSKDNLNLLARYATLNSSARALVRDTIGGSSRAHLVFKTENQLAAFLEHAPVYEHLADIHIEAALQWAQAYFMMPDRTWRYDDDDYDSWCVAYRPPLLEKVLRAKFPNATSLTLVLRAPEDVPNNRFGRPLQVPLMNMGTFERLYLTVVYDDDAPELDLGLVDLDPPDLRKDPAFEWHYQIRDDYEDEDDFLSDQNFFHDFRFETFDWFLFPEHVTLWSERYTVWYPMSWYLNYMRMPQRTRRMVLENVSLLTAMMDSCNTRCPIVAALRKAVVLESVSLCPNSVAAVDQTNIAIDHIDGDGAVVVTRCLEHQQHPEIYYRAVGKTLTSLWPSHRGDACYVPCADEVTLRVRDRPDEYEEHECFPEDALVYGFVYTEPWTTDWNSGPTPPLQIKRLTLVLEDISLERTNRLLDVVRRACDGCGCTLTVIGF